jgi:uncharacterized protein (TIGR04255 family)
MFSTENYDVALPGRFFEKIQTKFPLKNDIRLFPFPPGANSIPNNDLSLLQAPRMQAWNESRTSCLQIGPGIIAANETKYLDWETFTESIKMLLKGYFDCVQPLETQKIGFRCINRFVIPEEKVMISDYFRIGLALPNELQGVEGFGVNLFKKILNNNVEISVVIRFASDVLKIDERGMAFILDIDSYILKDLGTDARVILDAATQCHNSLKFVFESILQDKMRILLGGVRR